jgi:hypothetical protein
MMIGNQFGKEIQSKPTNAITFGQTKSDNINRMITGDIYLINGTFEV